ncbi:hypothetical protein [Halorussus litoreus]|uniref:hypothetical protein n=1 Tax=Halorussus litoreus TaxID=1710536 RepID=UPI001E608D93|nr:hypothetical protein [Halorussus litoreus]
MSSSLRPVLIKDETGNSTRANHVVGVDESGNDASTGGVCVTVAVRTHRRNDSVLVRALIESGLKPFKFKSSTLVRYGEVNIQERERNVASFINSLQETPITWTAIVCKGSFTQHEQATATSMAAKKAITSAIGQAVNPDKNEPATLLHDGAIDNYREYEKRLREQVAEDFGSSFRHGVCPVHLTFLQNADRTYPQSNAADYIAGYIRSKLESTETIGTIGHNNIKELDPSWVRNSGETSTVYKLAELKPIREMDTRSRALSWLMGKGIPVNPTPTTQDPFRDLVSEIPDKTVRDYLLTEI